MKMLIVLEYYFPGYKSGGPAETIKNFIKYLNEDIDIYLIVGDRDVGENVPYRDIKIDQWLPSKGYKLKYIPRNLRWFSAMLKEILLRKYDIIYLNSYFNLRSSIFPLVIQLLKKRSRAQIILAPRGEFSKGAIKINGFKKSAYKKLAYMLGWQKEIIWLASSEVERADIEREIRDKPLIMMLPNITEIEGFNSIKKKRRIKRRGELKIVYVSRIAKKKNLYFALEIMDKLKKNGIKFRIIGPTEESIYWNLCKRQIAKINKKENKVVYRGSLKRDEVIMELYMADLLFLPTLGENYCHVILESLSVGCPVIISDQTPWKDLSCYNAGYEIPLKNEEQFEQTILSFYEMSNSEYQKWREGASNYYENVVNYGKAIDINRSTIRKIAETANRNN